VPGENLLRQKPSARENPQQEKTQIKKKKEIENKVTTYREHDATQSGVTFTKKKKTFRYGTG